MRKFFEDPNGGRDYTGSEGYSQGLKPGHTFGFGYELDTGNVFFTRNGGCSPNAFVRKYLPSRSDDVGYGVYNAARVYGRKDVTINLEQSRSRGRRVMWLSGELSAMLVNLVVRVIFGMSCPHTLLLCNIRISPTLRKYRRCSNYYIFVREPLIRMPVLQNQFGQLNTHFSASSSPGRT